VGGFLVASAITLGGAAGELWVVDRSGQKLDLGGWEDRILILAVAGFVLLALYAIRTIPATIRHGTTKPPATRPDDTKAATESIIAALQEHGHIGATKLSDALEEVTTRFPEIAPPARPRRSALL
jgi:hypothetical protein